jgi:hypothetical protein
LRKINYFEPSSKQKVKRSSSKNVATRTLI